MLESLYNLNLSEDAKVLSTDIILGSQYHGHEWSDYYNDPSILYTTI